MIRISFLLYGTNGATAIRPHRIGNDHNSTRKGMGNERGKAKLRALSFRVNLRKGGRPPSMGTAPSISVEKLFGALTTRDETYSPAQTHRAAPACASFRAGLPAAARARAT